MADVTKIKALAYLQQVRPTNRKWRLAKRMTATDTQAVANFEPTDEAGNPIAVPFEITIGVERMLVTSYTGAVLDVDRGMFRGGLDFDGDAANAEAHDDGDEIVPSVSPLMIEMFYRCFIGTIATSGTAFRIGNEADDDIYLYAQNADANKPYLKYDKATNSWVLSNDGVAEVSMASGGVSTSSLGIDIVGGDIRLDFTDTTAIIETTSGVADAGKLVKTDANGLIKDDNVEKLKDIIATSTEINKLAGFTGSTVGLNAVAGSGGDIASTYHTHSQYVILSTPLTTSRLLSSASGAVVIAHGLGRTPKSVQVTAIVGGLGQSYGSSNGTLNRCTTTGAGGSTLVNNSNCIYIQNSTVYSTATITFDATNITINWTRVSSIASTAYIHLNVIA